MMVTQKVVIPAKAGIQGLCNQLKTWIPAFAGMTGKFIAPVFAIASSMAQKALGDDGLIR